MHYKLELTNEEENEITEAAMREYEEQMKDPEYYAEYQRISAEGALLQSIPCPAPCENEETESNVFQVQIQARKQNLKVLKLRDLESPVIGTYQGKEPCKFGCCYAILTKEGLVKIYGCSDLDSKMNQIALGKMVYIALAEVMVTSNGRAFVKADVRVTI